MNDWSELYPDANAPLGIDVLGDEHPNPNQDGRARREPMSAEELERYQAWVDGVAKHWEIKK